MDVTDKSAQPSMEEILASIRKLLSEESDQRGQDIDFNARPILLNEDDEEETSEFDLPAIFRSSSASSESARRERTTASLVRLTDAIRSVAGGAVAAAEIEAASARLEGGPQLGLSALKLEEPLAVTIPQAREFEFAGAETGSLVGSSDRLDDGSFFESAQVASPRQVEPMREPLPLAEPLRVTASSDPRDVQRVMAPFKDTKFMSLSTPSVQAAPKTVEAIPQAAPPAPVKTAIVEPKLPDVHDFKREPVLPGPPARKDVKQGLSSAFPQAASAHREVSPHAADIEEASADLLRPMLRSWLAENMPKMVEKALVLEMQQQLGSLKKSGGSES